MKELSFPSRILFSFLAVGVFSAVLGGVAYRGLRVDRAARAEGEASWIYSDFRSQVFYPVLALHDGINPYDTGAYMTAYPAPEQFAPYLPAHLLLYSPLSLVDETSARDMYFLLQAGVLLVLSYLALRLAGVPATWGGVAGLAAVLVISRPGSSSLLLGQVAVQTVIGTYLAFLFAQDRPRLAGLGLFLAALKPSFGVPLAIMLWAQRRYATVLWGAGLALCFSLPVLVMLAIDSGGVLPLMQSMLSAAGSWQASVAAPQASFTRVDLPALLMHVTGRPLALWARVAVAFTLIGLGCFGAARLRRSMADPRASVLSGSIVCLVILLCAYHGSYDLLLLAFPLTAMARWLRHTTGRAPWWQWTAFLVLLIPTGNYLASAGGIRMLGQATVAGRAITMLNPLCLTVALSAYLLAAWKFSRAPIPQPQPLPGTPGPTRRVNPEGSWKRHFP